MPAHPQKVAVNWYLGDICALGIKPVAFSGWKQETMPFYAELNGIEALKPWEAENIMTFEPRMLNAIRLGNQTAAGLGLAVKREFIGLSLAAVALSLGSEAVGGNFFFVGMISPHLARRLVGPNHKLLLPAASLTGALVVLLADTITRTVSMGTDVPTGIVITLLSTPYFLYLLAKSD